MSLASTATRITTRLPLLAAATFGLVTAQVLYAAHRRDLPDFEGGDPSGFFGDPSLPRLRIAVVGDSSVTAPGIEHIDLTWARRVARVLARRYHVDLRSFAVGGSKAADVLRDQLVAALAVEPDLVIVAVGSNDALRGTPAWRMARDFDQILRTIDGAGAAAVVMGIGDLGTIPRLLFPSNRLVSLRSIETDRIWQRICGRYPSVVKCRMWEETAEAFRVSDGLFAPDQFHASGAGHALWVAPAMAAIEEALSVRPPAT